jgi:hypothetical protein
MTSPSVKALLQRLDEMDDGCYDATLVSLAFGGRDGVALLVEAELVDDAIAALEDEVDTARAAGKASHGRNLVAKCEQLRALAHAAADRKRRLAAYRQRQTAEHDKAMARQAAKPNNAASDPIRRSDTIARDAECQTLIAALDVEPVTAVEPVCRYLHSFVMSSGSASSRSNARRQAMKAARTILGSRPAPA